MAKTQNVTLQMIYKELKSMRQELVRVEHAIIPTEKLSSKELAEHKKDLAEALKDRTNFREL